MKLTPNFYLAEFTFSRNAQAFGIDNTAPAEVIPSLQKTAEGLEKIRALLGGKRIKITSGYRCKALNDAVQGSRRSQHMIGEAVDFQCIEFGTPKEIVKFLSPHVVELGIDQIIQEGTWVHVSFSSKPRGEVLTYMGSGRYARGVV